MNYVDVACLCSDAYCYMMLHTYILIYMLKRVELCWQRNRSSIKIENLRNYNRNLKNELKELIRN